MKMLLEIPSLQSAAMTVIIDLLSPNVNVMAEVTRTEGSCHQAC